MGTRFAIVAVALSLCSPAWARFGSDPLLPSREPVQPARVSARLVGEWPLSGSSYGHLWVASDGRTWVLRGDEGHLVAFSGPQEPVDGRGVRVVAGSEADPGGRRVIAGAVAVRPATGDRVLVLDRDRLVRLERAAGGPPLWQVAVPECADALGQVTRDDAWSASAVDPATGEYVECRGYLGDPSYKVLRMRQERPILFSRSGDVLLVERHTPLEREWPESLLDLFDREYTELRYHARTLRTGFGAGCWALEAGFSCVMSNSGTTTAWRLENGAIAETHRLVGGWGAYPSAPEWLVRDRECEVALVENRAGATPVAFEAGARCEGSLGAVVVPAGVFVRGIFDGVPAVRRYELVP